MQNTSLLFVYNAKSDFWSKKLDFAHKIVSPSTYSCSLCALTHGNFGETEVWKNFREHSGIEMKFMYKDEFQKLEQKNITTNFPVILKVENNIYTPILTTKELSVIKTVEDLIFSLKKDYLPQN